MGNYFGNNLKYLRRTNNISQKEIARVTGKEISLIGKWESHQREATMDSVLSISKFFDVSIDDLVNTDLSIKTQFSLVDDRDIGEVINDLLFDLKSEQVLMFNGSPLNEDDRELLERSIGLGFDAVRRK